MSNLPVEGTPCIRARRGGFSLVEITLALGIVATVLVALMGLLPMGMDSIREAKSNMVEARIAYEIMGELQVANWGEGDESIRQYDGEIRSYDGEGTLIKESKGSGRADTVYQAKIEVSPDSTRLPGGAINNNFLRHAVVKVAFSPNGRTVNFDGTGRKKGYKVYTTELVKLNHDA